MQLDSFKTTRNCSHLALADFHYFAAHPDWSHLTLSRLKHPSRNHAQGWNLAMEMGDIARDMPEARLSPNDLRTIGHQETTASTQYLMPPPKINMLL